MVYLSSRRYNVYNEEEAWFTNSRLRDSWLECSVERELGSLFLLVFFGLLVTKIRARYNAESDAWRQRLTLNQALAGRRRFDSRGEQVITALSRELRPSCDSGKQLMLLPWGLTASLPCEPAKRLMTNKCR